jgi:hypothetical protein
MARVRLSPGRAPLLAVAGSAISAGAAAELSSHAARSTASTVRQTDAVPQSELRLVAPPPAFTSGRLPPSSGRRDATRWAPVLHATIARRTPGGPAERAGLVPKRTGDGTTNVVVADGEAVRHGVLWERVPLTALPNGTQGWVPRRVLGGWSFVHTRLVVDRSRLDASLYRGGA